MRNVLRKRVSDARDVDRGLDCIHLSIAIIFDSPDLDLPPTHGDDSDNSVPCDTVFVTLDALSRNNGSSLETVFEPARGGDV